MTHVKQGNLLRAMPRNFRPKDRITGSSVLKCSRRHICRKHNPLRTTDVKIRLTRSSLTLHYGLVYVRSRGVGGRSYKHLRARRTSILIHFLRRHLNGRQVRFCANIRCHRLLIVGKNGGRLHYAPPRSMPKAPFQRYLVRTRYPRTRRAISLLGHLVLSSRGLLTSRPLGLRHHGRKHSPTGDV